MAQATDDAWKKCLVQENADFVAFDSSALAKLPLGLQRNLIRRAIERIHPDSLDGRLRRQFFNHDGRARFREKGVDLLWIDIGYFEAREKEGTEPPVHGRQDRWLGNADIVRAYNETQRMAFGQMGRAEAQAELLIRIVHGLEDVPIESKSRQNTCALYLERIAHILDGIRKQQSLPPGELAQK